MMPPQEKTNLIKAVIKKENIQQLVLTTKGLDDGLKSPSIREPPCKRWRSQGRGGQKGQRFGQFVGRAADERRRV